MNNYTLHSVTSKQMLAELYFGMDSITLAQQALDSIAVWDTSDEAEDFIALMEVFIDLRQADTSLNGLDSAQLVTVTKIAEGHTSMALSAEGILYALNGEHVHHPIYKIEEEAGKRGWEKEISEPVRAEIVVYPNPTTGEITFGFSRNTLPGTSICFYDIRGQKIEELPIPEGIGGYRVLLNLPGGLYLYRIQNEGDVIQSGKVILLK